MGLDEPISVHDHDPEWAVRADALMRSLAAVCHGLSIELAHIGSTAVAGLRAKSVIDIQIGVDVDDIGEVVARLVAAGFEHVPDAGVEGRQYLRRRDGIPANVHVVERDGNLWRDNILFRDHLRQNPAAALRYQQVKEDAARQHPWLLAYSDAKAAAVNEILTAARARAEASGGPDS